MPSFTALGLGFYLSLLCEGHLRRHECLVIDNTVTEFFGFIFQFLKIMFPSLIQELIWHQHQSGNPVTSRSGAILKSPVTREKWELNNDDVDLVEKIGRGNFGDVYKARLKQNNLSVAVKTCKVTLPDEQKKKFLQEGRILKQYEHPNIVRFIGICVQKQPIMIVMELVSGGSLLNYLRTSSEKLTTKALLGKK